MVRAQRPASRALRLWGSGPCSTGATRVGWVVLLFLALGGCASKRQWIVVGKVEDYRHVQDREGVAVAVEPWTRHDDLRAVCKKPPGDDVLALRVVIFNRATQTVRFSSTQARVCLPGGKEICPLPVSEVTRRLESDEGVAAAIVHIGTAGYGAVIASAIAEGAAEENWKRQCAARKCSITLATLDPGEKMNGFLFYQHPRKGGRWVRESPVVEFRIHRMPRQTGPPLDFAIQVPLREPTKRKESR